MVGLATRLIPTRIRPPILPQTTAVLCWCFCKDVLFCRARGHLSRSKSQGLWFGAIPEAGDFQRNFRQLCAISPATWSVWPLKEFPGICKIVFFTAIFAIFRNWQVSSNLEKLGKFVWQGRVYTVW